MNATDLQELSPTAGLSVAEQCLLLLYRAATYVTLHVIDDAALLAFGLS